MEVIAKSVHSTATQGGVGRRASAGVAERSGPPCRGSGKVVCSTPGSADQGPGRLPSPPHPRPGARLAMAKAGWPCGPAAWS